MDEFFSPGLLQSMGSDQVNIMFMREKMLKIAAFSCLGEGFWPHFRLDRYLIIKRHHIVIPSCGETFSGMADDE
jgi:hypothetical protein